MRADQMQQAAKDIAALLKNSDILDIIRQCRVAAADKKHASLAKLGHAGAVLMESTEKLDKPALLVLKQLHLDSLTSPGYWRNLLADTNEEKARQAELVRLYSRVLFATNHLPSLLNLMSSVGGGAGGTTSVTEGEQILTIKLTDAGERASDPDRLARAIDGIDMLYSACASLAKKPAMDLELINVTGSTDRDINFLGDLEAIQAVKTIIESIPDAIVDIDPEEEIDIQHLVQSLPIFDDLKVLQKMGTYTPSDLQDIRDTMHQGVLLSLESGVVLVYAENEERASPSEPVPARRIVKAVPSVPVLQAATGAKDGSGAAVPKTGSSAEKRPAVRSAVAKPSSEKASGAELNSSAAGEKDEFYDQYLKERERLQSGAESTDVPEDGLADKRDNAINNLLRGLKK